MCDSITQTELAALLSPFTIGGQVGLLLYGIYLCMHFHYFKGSLYSRLSTPVKATLWSVLLLITTHYALVYVEIVSWQVSTNNDPESVYTGNMLDAIIPFFGGLVAVPVQLLLALRASAWIRRQWIRYSFLAFVGSTILLAFTGAILTSAVAISSVDGIPYSQDGLGPDYNDFVTMWQWSTAVTDVAVSFCLALTLNSRIQGFSSRTDGLLKRLVLTAIRTAAYTAVLAVAGAILSAAVQVRSLRVTHIHQVFWYPLPACYGLSLYTTLTARHTINKHIGGGGAIKGAINVGAANLAAAGGDLHDVGARGVRRSASSAHVNEGNTDLPWSAPKEALQWREEKDGWAAAMRLRTRETLDDDVDGAVDDAEDVVEVRKAQERLGSRLVGGIGAGLDDLAEKGEVTARQDPLP